MNNENKQPIENTAPEQPEAQQEASADALTKAAKKIRSAEVIRRLRHGRVATIITVGVIILTLLLNVFFYILGKRYPLNLDVTSNQVFSLSDQSVTIAKSLTEKVEIVVFTSEETFSNIQSDDSIAYHYGFTSNSTIFTQFYNATRQYNALTDGKVTVTYIDTERNPAAVAKYNSYKDGPISKGDILFISKNSSRNVSISDLYGDIDQQIYYYYQIPVATSSMVEQVLASNLKAVQSEKEMVISLATGFDEDGNTLLALKELYTLNGYAVEEVNLTGSTPINTNTVCLVIAAPATDYTPETIEKLRTWLSNDGKEGRNLMVFAHPNAKCPNLFEFLKVDYGMEVTDNIISEGNLNYVYENNPYFTYGTAADTDYTTHAAGERVLAPLCRQIIPHWEAQTDKSVQYSVNLLTFSESAQITPLEQLENAQTAPPASDYNGEMVGMAVAVKDGYQNALQTATSTKVAVCGSSYLVNFLSLGTVVNEELVLDSMTKISGYTNPVNISSKSLETVKIFFSSSDKIVYGDIIFSTVLPLGLLLSGLIVFLRRRHL